MSTSRIRPCQFHETTTIRQACFQPTNSVTFRELNSMLCLPKNPSSLRQRTYDELSQPYVGTTMAMFDDCRSWVDGCALFEFGFCVARQSPSRTWRCVKRWRFCRIANAQGCVGETVSSGSSVARMAFVPDVIIKSPVAQFIGNLQQ